MFLSMITIPKQRKTNTMKIGILHLGITKPLNMKETSIDKLAAVEAATIVRRTDASNRNMDIDVK